MKRVLIFAHDANQLYYLRKELIVALCDLYSVAVVLPSDSNASSIEAIGCKCIYTKFNRHGTNPVSDMILLVQYSRIIKKEKPDVVLSYTIKPNIYGGIACSIHNVPYINNITGLGVIGKKGVLQKLLFFMQRLAFKKSACVFFQNKDNLTLYSNLRIVKDQARLIPGSGVNLHKFKLVEYPSENGIIKFLTVARLRKDKGFDELFSAIRVLKDTHLEFNIIGDSEDDHYIKEIETLQRNHLVRYHGFLAHEDVRKHIADCHCLIHPSHSEGMANVILESVATARPVIATDISGCREAVENNINGFLFPIYNSNALIEQIKRFIVLPWEKKRDMGIAGRSKIKREFDRNIVINAYLEEINKSLQNRTKLKYEND